MISEALNFCFISSSPTHRTIASSSDSDELASSVSITFFSKLSFLTDFYNSKAYNSYDIKPCNDLELIEKVFFLDLWYIVENEAEQPLSLVLNSH